MVIVTTMPWTLVCVESNSEPHGVNSSWNIVNVDLGKLFRFLGVVLAVDATMGALHLGFVPKS